MFSGIGFSLRGFELGRLLARAAAANSYVSNMATLSINSPLALSGCLSLNKCLWA